MPKGLIWEEETNYYRVVSVKDTVDEHKDDAPLPAGLARPKSFRIQAENQDGVFECVVRETFYGLQELIEQFEAYRRDPERNEPPYVLFKRAEKNGQVDYYPSRDPYIFPPESHET